MWALSEAALGGVLHAFQVPFTGLFINAASIIFITLIAFYSNRKREVLEATAIVLIVKAGVSPHTPLNAYFAVSVQGLLGAFLFRSKKKILFPAIALGILTMLQSALQRIIVLTIIFGVNLWESINIFGNYLLEQAGILDKGQTTWDISLWLILGYIIIHLIAGVLVGIYAARIPGWVKEEELKQKEFTLEVTRRFTENRKKEKRKKKRWLKPGSIAIILLAAAIMVLSYVFPELESSSGRKAVIMIIRSTLIMLLWYTFAGPLLRRLYNRSLARKKYKYSKEVEQSIQLMPALKVIVADSWGETRNLKGLPRVRKFITLVILALFTVRFPEE